MPSFRIIINSPKCGSLTPCVVVDVAVILLDLDEVVDNPGLLFTEYKFERTFSNVVIHNV